MNGAHRSWRCRKCRPNRPSATASSPERRSTTGWSASSAWSRNQSPPTPPHVWGWPGATSSRPASSTRSPRRSAASVARSSSPTASPDCCAARRCSPTATRAGATTAVARKDSCRPTLNWLWSTRNWVARFASTSSRWHCNEPFGPPWLPAPQVVHELLVVAGLVDEFVAGLARKRLEVTHRTRVGGNHLQHLARQHLRQGLLGLEDGQRAVQAAGVEFFLGDHREADSRPSALAYAGNTPVDR